MAKLFRSNGSVIAPCIIAQVHYALDNTWRQPQNTKKCSTKYWNEVVEIVAKEYNLPNFKDILK